MATEIGTVTSRASASAAPSGTSRQPRLGAVDTKPSLRRTTPTTATPTPTSGSSAGRRERSSAASSARSAAIASTEVWPLGRSMRIRSKTSPPSPTMAAAIESTAISSPRTTAPRGLRQTTGEGRPGTPCGSARSSDDEAGGRQLADQATDRAAGQARPRDELGTRRGTARMELAHDRAQIGAADRFAALPDRFQPHRHRICVPSFQML